MASEVGANSRQRCRFSCFATTRILHIWRASKTTAPMIETGLKTEHDLPLSRLRQIVPKFSEQGTLRLRECGNGKIVDLRGDEKRWRPSKPIHRSCSRLDSRPPSLVDQLAAPEIFGAVNQSHFRRGNRAQKYATICQRVCRDDKRIDCSSLAQERAHRLLVRPSPPSTGSPLRGFEGGGNLQTTGDKDSRKESFYAEIEGYIEAVLSSGGRAP